MGGLLLRKSYVDVPAGPPKIWLSLYQFFTQLSTHQYNIFDRKAPNFVARGCSGDLHYDRPRNLPSNPRREGWRTKWSYVNELPILPRSGAFCNNLLKIHPIYVIWAARHIYVYQVNVRTPPPPSNACISTELNRHPDISSLGIIYNTSTVPIPRVFF